MSTVAVSALLRRVAELCEGREPLPAGLRASALPGADRLADRLDGGASLDQAFAGVIDPRLAAQLVGPRPGLAAIATLAADELELRHYRRELLATMLAYPLVCIAALGLMAWYLQAGHEIVLEWRWLALGLPGLVIVLLAAIPWSGAVPLGPLVGWRRHLLASRRYARAAVAARWRIPEADCARLLGGDLAAVAPLLGCHGAEQSCRRLELHHRAASRRASRVLGWVLTAGVTLLAGGLALAAAEGLWSELTEELNDLALELEASSDIVR